MPASVALTRVRVVQLRPGEFAGSDCHTRHHLCGHIMDETKWTEERPTLPGVLVNLHHVPSPISDDASTIRCRCLRGCRKRCPLGRRLPCASCGLMVGPCCGLRSVSAPPLGNAEPSHVIVCHVCLGGRLNDRCQWDPNPGYFPLMTVDELLRWQRCSRQSKEHRAELIWSDLVAEVCRDLGSQPFLSRPSAPLLPSSPS